MIRWALWPGLLVAFLMGAVATAGGSPAESTGGFDLEDALGELPSERHDAYLAARREQDRLRREHPEIEIVVEDWPTHSVTMLWGLPEHLAERPVEDLSDAEALIAALRPYLGLLPDDRLKVFPVPMGSAPDEPPWSFGAVLFTNGIPVLGSNILIVVDRATRQPTHVSAGGLVHRAQLPEFPTLPAITAVTLAMDAMGHARFAPEGHMVERAYAFCDAHLHPVWHVGLLPADAPSATGDVLADRALRDWVAVTANGEVLRYVVDNDGHHFCGRVSSGDEHAH